MKNQDWNTNREASIGAAAASAIARSVPSGWEVRWIADAGETPDRGYDGVLEIRSPRETARFRGEVKATAYPMRTVNQMRARGFDRDGVLIAPWLDARVRAELDALQISYVDTAGNCRLACDDPTMFIRLDGGDRPALEEGPGRPARSTTLRGAGAAAIVRTLVDMDLSLPVTTYELAELAGVSQPQAWRVVELLGREGVIERDESSRVAGYDWERVLDRWIEDYSRTNTSSRAIRCATLQGVDGVLERLARWDGPPVAVTGAVAAAAYAPLAQPKQLVLYSRQPVEVVSELRLIETASPPEVIVLQPKFNVVFDRVNQIGGIPFCAPAQVVADLARERSRAAVQREELLRWMRDTSRWRVT